MSLLGKLKSQLSQTPAKPPRSGDYGTKTVAADATKNSEASPCPPDLQDHLPPATEYPPDMPDYSPRDRQSEDGPIRLPRVPPFPASVFALQWPRASLGNTKEYPSYLKYLDGVWERFGNSRQVSYRIVQLPPRPLWHVPGLYGKNDPDPPFGWRDGIPNDCPCCYGCGRRLFYKTADDREYCALCFPIYPARTLAGNFAGETAETGLDDAYSFDNVVFFLKPGVGLDW